MNIIQSIVLGIVQGLTEFIPVSSSAHLDIVPYLLGWKTPSIIFDLALHFGTLLALLVYFRHELFNITRDVVTDVKRKHWSDNTILARNIAIATIPAAIIGVVLQNKINSFYKSSSPEELKLSIIYTCIALIVVGILFLFVDRLPRLKTTSLGKMPISSALIIGVAQAIALFRGVSRSGITLLTGQTVGLKRVDAAQFTFLMSIPIMILTTVYGFYELLHLQGTQFSDELGAAIVGAITAFAFGLLAINYLMKFLRKNGLYDFGLYRIALGILVLLIVLR